MEEHQPYVENVSIFKMPAHPTMKLSACGPRQPPRRPICCVFFPFCMPFVLTSSDHFPISDGKSCLRAETILPITHYNWKQWVFKHSLPNYACHSNKLGLEVSANKAKVPNLSWVDICSVP